MEDVEKLKSQMALATKLEEDDYQESLSVFENVLPIALQLKDKSAEATCHEGMARVLWKMSDSPKAHKRYREALAIYTEQGDYYGISRAYSGLGIISSNSEDYATALEFFDKALIASRKAGMHSFTAVLTANVGNVYFNLGRYADAMKCFERALEYHQEHNNEKEIAIMLTGMAGVHVYTQRYNEGLELLQRALAIDKKQGRIHGVLMCQYNIGETYRKQGKTQLALKQQLEALALSEKIKARSMMYQIHEQLSGLYQELDEPEKSAHHLELYKQAEGEESNWVVKRENEKLQQYNLADR